MKTKYNTDDDLGSEYNFDYSKAVRGKHFKQLMQERANLAVLDQDIAKAFTSSAAVNDALRLLLKITRSTQRITNVQASA